jgi:hypothetical protein
MNSKNVSGFIGVDVSTKVMKTGMMINPITMPAMPTINDPRGSLHEYKQSRSATLSTTGFERSIIGH